MRIINSLNLTLTSHTRNNYTINNLVIRLVQDNIKGLKLIGDYKAGDMYYDRVIDTPTIKMATAMYDNIQKISHINHLIPQINTAISLDKFLNQTGLEGTVPIALYSGNCLWIYVASNRLKQIAADVAIYALAIGFIDVTPDFSPEVIVLNVYAENTENITNVTQLQATHRIDVVKKELTEIAIGNSKLIDEDYIDPISKPKPKGKGK